MRRTRRVAIVAATLIATLVDLPPGDFTVVCLGLGAEGPTVSGRTMLRAGVG